MHSTARLGLAALAVAGLLAACTSGPFKTSSASSASGTTASSTASSGRNAMSFFITSANPGQGANFGGLAGADRYCQTLATAVGAGGKTWHAYLSTTAAGGQPAVNARDRIGNGPWYNAKGEMVAANLAELHGTNKLGKETSLTEKGTVVNGFGDTPNTHDILTGSTPDGRASSASGDTTCSNWTSSDQGSALMGHHDRKGTNPDPVANASWNSSHGSRGCSPAGLASTGSGGLLYCFAVN
jgi:hypothetical protein